MKRSSPTVLVGLSSAAIALCWFALVPRQQLHIDHFGTVATLRRMRGGQGYYGAIRDTYLYDTVGIRLGSPRAFRMPYMFEILRFVPESALLSLFVLVVVVGTCSFLAASSEHPYAAVPVALLISVLARQPGEPHIDTWMFVEYWTLPFLALSYWGWRKDRRWAAAMGAAAATLVRELALPVVLFGLALALVRRRDRTPWVVALGVSTLGLAVHTFVALQYGVEHGTEAKLLGSAELPRTVLEMVGCGLPHNLGALIWLAGIVHVARRRLITPILPLLGMPLLGLAVDRAYWGILVMPFIALWTCELLGDVWRRADPAVNSSGRSAANLLHTPSAADRHHSRTTGFA